MACDLECPPSGRRCIRIRAVKESGRHFSAARPPLSSHSIITLSVEILELLAYTFGQEDLFFVQIDKSCPCMRAV